MLTGTPGIDAKERDLNVQRGVLLANRWFAAFVTMSAGVAFPQNAPAQTPAMPIKHVIIMMQENRSFDSYFGKFPGANGIPDGVCMPINMKVPAQGCVKPFHNQLDVNVGASHSAGFAWDDLDDGVKTAKMDGFIKSQLNSGESKCQPNYSPVECFGVLYGFSIFDVMGYHTDSELWNYWQYAKHFVLQDSMFEGERNWSLPSHLDMTSEWSALCSDNTQALSCITESPGYPNKSTQFPWATLFQLFDINNVSWKYYVGVGTQPDCDDGAATCPPTSQSVSGGTYWNPAPFYLYVKQQGKAYFQSHVFDANQFIKDVQSGNLAQVTWIVPVDEYSEHPPQGISAGMDYVTMLVNTVMQSPYWQNTAIFLSWDDWGGFYDHVDPPNVFPSGIKGLPVEGFGLRVPAMMISAWAKSGLIDHQVYSFESYIRFMEDLFAGGARLDPAALGNPDNRVVIRDEVTQVTYLDGTTAPIGDLMSEFDFSQTPLPPFIQNQFIPSGIFANCYPTQIQTVCQSPTVTISWNPVVWPGGEGPFSYRVLRDNTELKQCAGQATSCVDTPGPGTHYYRAYSLTKSKERSPLSGAAVVVEP